MYYTITRLKPLKQKVNEGWDDKWIERSYRKLAKDFLLEEERYSDSMMSYDYGNNYGSQHYEGLIKVITTYRKELDEDDVPVVTKTCWTEEMDEAGFHEPVGYDEGRYPFVCITREHLNHRLLDSRGYPELLKSYQIAVKTELDSRRDAASMTTMPPIHVSNWAAVPSVLGPGCSDWECVGVGMKSDGWRLRGIHRHPPKSRWISAGWLKRSPVGRLVLTMRWRLIRSNSTW